MTVLVAYASLHGSTRGIAELIARVLEERGLDVEVRGVETSPDPGTYDAVVLGSAVYRGSWMREALEFSRHHASLLADRPVWLFSSGPLGVKVEEMEEQVWDTLRTCYDPEIPVNIADLGLVYRCEVVPLEGKDYRVEIDMTLTAPACGMGDVLRTEAETKT